MFRYQGASRTGKSDRTSSNLYLQLKWDLMNYETHRFNVKNAKPSIDNGAPRTYSHLYYRPKKMQLELERYCNIQRENKNLMHKIAKIQKGDPWIDNKNDHVIKSLNTWKRQKDMIELAYDNQCMLNRLLDCHTVYNRNKIHDEYLINLKHRANIEKFPKDWKKIQDKIKGLKKIIKKKVLSEKTGKRFPDLEKEMEKWTMQKEVHRKLRQRREEQRRKEEEERARREEEERSEASQQRNVARKKYIEASKKWREARDQRLQAEKERMQEVQQLEEDIKTQQEEGRKKRQREKKKKLAKWKEEREEEQRRAQEAAEKEEKEKKALQKLRKKVQKEKTKLKTVESEEEDDVEEKLSESNANLYGEEDEPVAVAILGRTELLLPEDLMAKLPDEIQTLIGQEDSQYSSTDSEMNEEELQENISEESHAEGNDESDVSAEVEKRMQYDLTSTPENEMADEPRDQISDDSSSSRFGEKDEEQEDVPSEHLDDDEVSKSEEEREPDSDIPKKKSSTQAASSKRTLDDKTSKVSEGESDEDLDDIVSMDSVLTRSRDWEIPDSAIRDLEESHSNKPSASTSGDKEKFGSKEGKGLEQDPDREKVRSGKDDIHVVEESRTADEDEEEADGIKKRDER